MGNTGLSQIVWEIFEKVSCFLKRPCFLGQRLFGGTVTCYYLSTLPGLTFQASPIPFGLSDVTKSILQHPRVRSLMTSQSNFFSINFCQALLSSINNAQYFWVPRMVVVHMFDCRWCRYDSSMRSLAILNELMNNYKNSLSKSFHFNYNNVSHRSLPSELFLKIPISQYFYLLWTFRFILSLLSTSVFFHHF